MTRWLQNKIYDFSEQKMELGTGKREKEGG